MVVNPAVFEKDADSLATKPAGSGPVRRWTSYTQNANAELHKNPKYFQADEHQGRRASSSTRPPTPPPSVAVAAVRPVQRRPAPRQPGRGGQGGRARGAGHPSLYVATLDVNNTMAPFDDPEVVEALHYAIDREALVEDREVRRRRGQLPAVPARATSATTTSSTTSTPTTPTRRSRSSPTPATPTPVPVTISTSRPRRACPSCSRRSSRQVGFDREDRDDPARPVHPARLHRPLEGAGRRRLRRPRVAGAGLPGAVQRAPGLMNPGRAVQPRARAPRSTKVVATPTGRPDVRRAAAGGDQDRGHHDARTPSSTPCRASSPAPKSVSELPQHLAPASRFEGVTGLMSAAVAGTRPPPPAASARRGRAAPRLPSVAAARPAAR